MPSVDWNKDQRVREIVFEIDQWPIAVQRHPAVIAFRDRIISQAQSIGENFLVDLQGFVNAIRLNCWCRTAHHCHRY